MNLIELHILQSFPVTCLNRDDVGAPKSALFGGAQRARVSSQCWKRAIRIQAGDYASASFATERGHFVADRFASELRTLGIEEADARDIGATLATFIGGQNKKYKQGHKTDVAVFFSPGEITAIAAAAKDQLDADGKVQPKKGQLAKAIKAAAPHDLADVALFGRMVASDHTLMVEGAGLFSHALSTHAVASEIDFFSAVDDMNPAENEGAGHIGTLEFNSACYYRYVGLNLDLLADDDHLGHCSEDERHGITDAFLRASILSVPSARKNSMFGHNPPAYVLGLRRTGQPLSLINAFEKPVQGVQGYVDESISRLNAHWGKLADTYCIETDEQAVIPESNLDDFIKKLT